MRAPAAGDVQTAPVSYQSCFQSGILDNFSFAGTMAPEGSPTLSVAVVVGNPKARSRTYLAAHLVAERLAGHPPDMSLDLTDLGPALLDWSDPGVAELVTAVQASDLVIFASPTYKAAYTGLLKLFLDRFGTGSLAGVTAVPLMLGGHWKHALAADLLLKPVLVELGATCPTAGLFLLDSEWDSGPALDDWLVRAGPQVAGGLAQRRPD
jgi:FMN reductase